MVLLLKFCLVLCPFLLLIFELREFIPIPELRFTSSLFLWALSIFILFTLNILASSSTSSALVPYEPHEITVSEPPISQFEEIPPEDHLALSISTSTDERANSESWVVATFTTPALEIEIKNSEVQNSEEMNICGAIVPAGMIQLEVEEQVPSPPATPRTKMKRKKKRLISSTKSVPAEGSQRLSIDIEKLSLDDFNQRISLIIQQKRRQEWQLR